MGKIATRRGTSSKQMKKFAIIVLIRLKPGIVRRAPIMSQPWPAGYCEVRFDNARVPVGNLLGEEGAGFAIAEALMGQHSFTIACAGPSPGRGKPSERTPLRSAPEFNRLDDILLNWKHGSEFDEQARTGDRQHRRNRERNRNRARQRRR